MSDNFFAATFGPSTPGHVNLVSGQTHGATPPNQAGDTIDGTIIGDPQPTGDACTTRDNAAFVTGKNIGDLLTAKGISWGYFQDGFDLTITNPDGSKGCNRTHTSTVTGVKKTDYIPHHQPFQYYKSTANLTHVRPSFLKPPGYRDGHAGYSSPLDEQTFIVDTINTIEKTPEWANSTAIIIAWDDSDGWYDHQMGPILSQSNTTPTH
jgi:phospholipase C